MRSIYEYSNYQSYLLEFFHQKRGNQARLAEFVDCRPSFLTQVIDQKVGLSMEQALKVPDFLGLSKNEKMAFVMMVQKDKITDVQGKKFFDEQIQKLKIQNKTVKERLENMEELSEEAKAQYYSSWIYGAIHILCAFSDIETAEDVTRALGLERQTVVDSIQFLLGQGLLQTKNRKLSIGKRQIHLGHDSKYISSHHINWRLKTIEKLSAQNHRGTHFSSLIGISKKDADAVQEILLKAVSDINEVVKKSGEEAPYVINLDFFGL